MTHYLDSLRQMLPGLAFALTLAGTADAALSVLPTPGEYQISMETTQRTYDPTGVMVRVERQDGATGDTTVTLTAPGQKAVTTHYSGKGPITQCQGAYGPPPAPTPCRGLSQEENGVRTASIECAGLQQDHEFRRLGDGLWEKRLRVTPAAGGGSPPPPPQTQTAMAPVIAAMQERLKVAPPDEAADIRRQLAALQGALAGQPAPGATRQEIESVQRWKLVSRHCSAQR